MGPLVTVCYALSQNSVMDDTHSHGMQDKSSAGCQD